MNEFSRQKDLQTDTGMLTLPDPPFDIVEALLERSRSGAKAAPPCDLAELTTQIIRRDHVVEQAVVLRSADLVFASKPDWLDGAQFDQLLRNMDGKFSAAAARMFFLHMVGYTQPFDVLLTHHLFAEGELAPDHPMASAMRVVEPIVREIEGRHPIRPVRTGWVLRRTLAAHYLYCGQPDKWLQTDLLARLIHCLVPVIPIGIVKRRPEIALFYDLAS